MTHPAAATSPATLDGTPPASATAPTTPTRMDPVSTTTAAEQPRIKARFSQLLPYLAEHRGVLSFVIVLSILGAGASLAQPLLIGQVIALVEKNQPLGALVWL